MKRWLLALVAAVWTPVVAAQDLGLLLTSKPPEIVRDVLRLQDRFSASNPAQILVIGDSLAQGFGILLRSRVNARGSHIKVVNLGRVSTGLSRSDYYDWPAAYRREVASIQPAFTVAHFGSNDRQNVVTGGGAVRYGSLDWKRAYAARIEELLVSARRYGSLFFVIGPAPDRNIRLNAHIDKINPIFEQKAKEQGAIYFPISGFTAGPDGRWVRSREVDGRVIRLRSDDGSHFTAQGYGLVADRLLDDIARRYPSVDPDTPRFDIIILQ